MGVVTDERHMTWSALRRRSLWVFSPIEVILMLIPLSYVFYFRLNPDLLVRTGWGQELLMLLGRTGACTRADVKESFTRNERMFAIAEGLKRQSREIESLPNGLRHVATPKGNYWIPGNTNLSLVQAEQEMAIYERGEHKVRPGDVVLDCGANVGTFTRRALEEGAGKVVAIEVSPLNVEALQRTFAREIAEGRVVVYGKGVWNKDDTLELTVYDNSALDSLVLRDRPETEAPSRLVRVPLTTVDKIVSELGLQRVDFIKMDVEGAESEALAGARETISKFQPRMSVASENLSADQFRLPQQLRALNASYTVTCGPCTAQNPYEIRVDVLFVAPR